MVSYYICSTSVGNLGFLLYYRPSGINIVLVRTVSYSLMISKFHKLFLLAFSLNKIQKIQHLCPHFDSQ